MMLSTGEIQLVEGLTSPNTPYYLVYPHYLENSFTRVCDIWVSSQPITFSDGSYTVTDGVYYRVQGSTLTTSGEAFDGPLVAPAGELVYTTASGSDMPRISSIDYTYSRPAYICLLALLTVTLGTVLGRWLTGGV